MGRNLSADLPGRQGIKIIQIGMVELVIVERNSLTDSVCSRKSLRKPKYLVSTLLLFLLVHLYWIDTLIFTSFIVKFVNSLNEPLKETST